MGMFTQLSHNGQIYQFKTGWDNLEVYRLGDTIPWEPDQRYPGQHIDGVHPASDENGDDCLWVIIKDCRIVAVDAGAPSDWPGYQNQLRNRYDIRPPPHGLWSELAWAEAAFRQAQYEVRYQQFMAENPGSDAHGYYIQSLLKQPSLVQQILPVVEETAHTPGPGQAIHGEVYDAANARLMAAAPELLEALEEMVRIFNPDKQGIYEFARPQIEQARAIIKKVRGE